MTEVALEHQAHHVAGAIYGTILATTVVATAGHDPAGIDQVAILVLGTSVVFWLAHVYSLGLAARVVVRRPLHRHELVRLALAEWPMLQSSWPILVPLMLGVLGVVGTRVAIDLAMAVGIGALFTYGFVIGRQERLSWPRVVLSAMVAGSFGFAILALKVFVH